MNLKMLATSVLLILCNLALAEGQNDVSALVQSTALRQMNLYSRVSGYGTVMPELGATMNLNFPKAGSVTRLFVSPGQQVKRGADLLEISTDPAGMLAYSQADNAAVYARGELARVKSSFERQLVTRSQVEAAQKALKDAEQALAAQSALGQGAKQDKLKAPFNATVVSVALATGDRFVAGANLVQLVRTDFLRTRLGIEAEESRQISQGMKVRLTSIFNPQNTLEGEVTQVSGQIDPQTQLVDVTVRFKGNSLLPGAKVKGEISTSGHLAQAVPRQAVLRDNGGAYVFQIVNGRARRTDVKTGLEDNGWIEVQSSLVPNAPIVTLGNYELQDNMAVRESTP